MTHKFEYRHDDMDDDWEAFKGNACDTEIVATTVAEDYFDNSDVRDANDFVLSVEVRHVETPDNIDTFKVTAEYSVNFYADLQNEDTK